MRATLRLLPLLVRRSPRGSAGPMALCAAGVAVATLVAGTVLAAGAGFRLREARVVWRDPSPVASVTDPSHTDDATALQRRSTDWFEGEPIDRVDLAPTGDPAAVPTPPGVLAAPRPGTAVVSPALAELIRDRPADQLGDRFPTIVGEIGRAGLAHPDELVAVVGTTADQIGPPTTDPDPRAGGLSPGSPGPTVAIDRFDTSQVDQDLLLYRNLALVAVVLVTVPAVLLVGSAARLTAARREQRMAALRLAGATPASVRLLAAAETTVGAVVGAVAGVASSMLVTPALSGVEMAGGRWFTGDLRLSLGAAVLVVVAAGAVCAVTAAASLRRVATSPLGVARSTEPRPSRWPRLLGTAAAVALLAIATVASASSTFTGADGGPVDMTVPMVAALGTVIASLALVGPFITSLVGRAMVVGARRTPMLVAGRRVLEDPRAAYRTVGAVVLAGLVAGFLSGVVPTVRALGNDTPPGWAGATLERADADRLVVALRADAGHADDVEIDGSGSAPGAPDDPATVTVRARGDELERLRTSTASVRGGAPLVASDDDVYGDVGFTSDVLRGSLAVLVASLVLAFGASAVAAAAAVVDRRRVIGRLTLCGTDVRTLQRSRRLEAVLPLTVATAGSVGLGLLSSVLLMAGFGASPDRIVGPDLTVLLAIVVAAAAMGTVSAALSRPLLVNAARAATGTAAS